MKKFIYIGLFIGSYLGGLVPKLWGAGMFSMSGLFFSTIFAIFGAILGYKIGQKYF